LKYIVTEVIQGCGDNFRFSVGLYTAKSNYNSYFISLILHVSQLTSSSLAVIAITTCCNTKKLRFQHTSPSSNYSHITKQLMLPVVKNSVLCEEGTKVLQKVYIKVNIQGTKLRSSGTKLRSNGNL